jgi:hypothetical protein
MKTLTVELPNQAALKLASLEEQHGERVRQVLAQVVVDFLEKIEKSPETALRALEETYGKQAEQTPVKEVDFQTAAAYVVDKNLELYKRLA